MDYLTVSVGRDSSHSSVGSSGSGSLTSSPSVSWAVVSSEGPTVESLLLGSHTWLLADLRLLMAVGWRHPFLVGLHTAQLTT